MWRTWVPNVNESKACNLRNSEPLKGFQHREWRHAHPRKGTFFMLMGRMWGSWEDKSLGACHWGLVHLPTYLSFLHPHFCLCGQGRMRLPQRRKVTHWNFGHGWTATLFMSFGGRNRVAESWRETQAKKPHMFSMHTRGNLNHMRTGFP